MKYKLGVINEKGNKKDTKKRLKDYKKMFMNHICWKCHEYVWYV